MEAGNEEIVEQSCKRERESKPASKENVERDRERNYGKQSKASGKGRTRRAEAAKQHTHIDKK